MIAVVRQLRVVLWKCKQSLEDDPELQDLVLSIHHAFVITFDGSTAIKIIENQNGKRMVLNINN